MSTTENGVRWIGCRDSDHVDVAQALDAGAVELEVGLVMPPAAACDLPIRIDQLL